MINQEHILLLSLLILVALIVKFGGKTILHLLDNYISDIASKVNKARQLKREANDLQDQLKQQLHDCKLSMELAVDKTKSQAAELISNSKAEVEDLIKIRTQMAIDRISSFEQSTLNEVKSQSVELAVAAVKAVINDKLSSDHAKKIIERIASEYKNLH